MRSKHKLRLLSCSALGLFCFLAAGSMENSHSSNESASQPSTPGSSNLPAQTVAPKAPITVPVVQIQAKKQEIETRIKSACSWNSAPESAGFFLGMTIPEARSFAASSGLPMKCKKSEPIPSGSVSEMYAAMSSDNFTVDEVGRADTICETTVLENKIHLYFFQSVTGAPATLAKAYNSLDSLEYKSRDDWESLQKTYSQKFGVADQVSCKASVLSAEPSTIQWMFSEPFADRVPGQPNISLYFAIEDSDLIERGSAITKARDEASQSQGRDNMKKDFEEKSSKY